MTRSKDDANGDSRRPLLSEAQGQTWEGKRGGDLPEVDGAIAQDWEGSEVKPIPIGKLTKQGQPRKNFGREATTKSKDLVSRDAIPSLLPRLVKNAMRDYGGNIVLASNQLGVSVSKLERAIALSREIRRFVVAIKQTDRKYKPMPLHDVEADLERKIILYKSEALDEIHAIATIPINDNSAMMQVKLLAACKLYGDSHGTMMGDTINETLKALNNQFQGTRTKISAVRETLVFERGPQPELPALEGEASPS